MSSVPVGVYPLATAKGEAIPLAVAAPKATARITLVALAARTISLPAAQNICSVVVTSATLLRLGTSTAPLADNTLELGAKQLLPCIAYDLVLPSQVTFISMGDDSVVA